MQVLPKGGYNKGIVIPLRCSCPPGCECNSQQLRNWHHKFCGEPSFINQYGDIFCKNFKDQQECDGYFIQNARFQCGQSKTWQQFRSASQFLMAIAQGMQAAEFTLNDDQIVQFGTTLNQEVIRRWNR